MRSSFFSSFLLAPAFALAACSSTAEGTGREPIEPAAPAVAPSSCTARNVSECPASAEPAVGDPPSSGAVLYFSQPMLMEPTKRVAVYEDGTVRRTPVKRWLSVPAPRGQIVATLAPSDFARLRDVAGAITVADTRAYFERGVSSADADFASVLDVRSGRSCFLLHADRACVPSSLDRVRAASNALLEATERKWRDAQIGTVSIGDELRVAGKWPLTDAVEKDGMRRLDAAQHGALGGGALFALDGGDFVRVDAVVRSGPDYDVYLTRVRAASLDAGDSALRDELFATAGKFRATDGVWLGLELDAARFPRFKNRELLVLRDEGAAPRVFTLYAIEQLDVRGDGPLVVTMP